MAYDWESLRKGFIRGNFPSIAAYHRSLISKFGPKNVPQTKYFYEVAAKQKWAESKKVMMVNALDKFQKGEMTVEDEDLITEYIKNKRDVELLASDMVKIIRDMFNDKDITWDQKLELIRALGAKMDISDLINDAFRANDMRTKEQDKQPNTAVQINQGGKWRGFGSVEDSESVPEIEDAKPVEIEYGDLEDNEE